MGVGWELFMIHLLDIIIRGLLAMPLPSIDLPLLAGTVFSPVLEMIALLITGEILSTLLSWPYHVLFRKSSDDSSPTSAATLTCEEAVRGFHSCLDDQDSVAKVAVVTEQGGLFLYQFSLSPLSPSPIVATSSIQYVSSPHKVLAMFIHVV